MFTTILIALPWTQLLLLTLPLWVCMAQEATEGTATSNGPPCMRRAVKVVCGELPNSLVPFVQFPFCKPVCVSPVGIDKSTIFDVFTYDKSEEPVLPDSQVGQYQGYVEQLCNPCRNLSIKKFPLTQHQADTPAEMRSMRYTFTKHYIELLKEELPEIRRFVEDIFGKLTKTSIRGKRFALEPEENHPSVETPAEGLNATDSKYCSFEMRFNPILDGIPIGKDLRNKTTLEALQAFYPSLVNHTAHMLHIAHFVKTFTGLEAKDDFTCNPNSRQWTLPALDTIALAERMVGLMCHVSNLIFMLPHSALPYGNEFIADIVTKTLSLPLKLHLWETIYSEEPVWDYIKRLTHCSFIISTDKLLAQMHDYVKDNMRIRPYGCFMSNPN